MLNSIPVKSLNDKSRFVSCCKFGYNSINLFLDSVFGNKLYACINLCTSSSFINICVSDNLFLFSLIIQLYKPITS